jgi:hypothetical protein
MGNSKVLKKVGGSKTVPASYVTPAMRNARKKQQNVSDRP